MLLRTHSLLITVTFAAMAAFIVGCAGEEETTEVAQNDVHEEHAEHDHDDHSGWWCVEHGVPEEECALCQTKLVAEFKEKGDWCDEHDRPDSQCFTCHPENFEKFAARYEAKFGEQPPKPTE